VPSSPTDLHAAPSKFIFANQLRGIAALLVVATHYFGTSFAAQDLVGERTASPNLHFVPSAWVHLFELPYQGPFGVALFFLISGFVIPFSLKKTSLPGFLVNRAMRILPTYLCCLGIGAVDVALSARYWGLPFPYPPEVLLANGLLMNSVLGVPSMDLVNWTLSIEIKFYLVAALGATALFRRSPGWLLGFLAAALLAAWSWSRAAAPSTVVTMLAAELNYVIFMLAGSVFYQHVSGLISGRALLARTLLIVAAFSASWAIGPQHGQFPSITVFYYAAYACFGLCYALRGRFKPQRALDFLADVSYPLYCVHPLFGYCALKLLMHLGLPFGGAIVITLPCAIALAYAIHLSVETGSNALGRRWGAALSRRKTPAALAA